MLSGDLDAKWSAVQRKDRDWDGEFVFAVRTTGIFCRPSCPARTPMRKNVDYFDTHDDARTAGFRDCKRCNPAGISLEHRHVDTILCACRTIGASEVPLDTAALARAARLGEAHFCRLFRATTGVTPREYFLAGRAVRLASALTMAHNVTDAIYAAGFASPSRFYDAAAAEFGMAPRAFRRGGSGELIRYGTAQTCVGHLLVGAAQTGLCAIEIGMSPDALVAGLRARFPNAEIVADDGRFNDWIAGVLAQVPTPEAFRDLPDDVCKIAFQRRVWKALHQSYHA